jgi:hypothetical protein
MSVHIKQFHFLHQLLLLSAKNENNQKILCDDQPHIFLENSEFF